MQEKNNNNKKGQVSCLAGTQGQQQGQQPSPLRAVFQYPGFLPYQEAKGLSCCQSLFLLYCFEGRCVCAFCLLASFPPSLFPLNEMIEMNHILFVFGQYDVAQLWKMKIFSVLFRDLQLSKIIQTF